jgi:hypothetical protein
MRRYTETNQPALCPACHHADHDPGSCPDCPRCELHYDEAREWLARNGQLSLIERLEALAASWQGDAEFLEEGDETHNRVRIRLRARKASPRELAAEAARQCAVQLRAVLRADTDA